jgi:hypothetical protein
MVTRSLVSSAPRVRADGKSGRGRAGERGGFPSSPGVQPAPNPIVSLAQLRSSYPWRPAGRSPRRCAPASGAQRSNRCGALAPTGARHGRKPREAGRSLPTRRLLAHGEEPPARVPAVSVSPATSSRNSSPPGPGSRHTSTHVYGGFLAAGRTSSLDGCAPLAEAADFRRQQGQALARRGRGRDEQHTGRHVSGVRERSPLF